VPRLHSNGLELEYDTFGEPAAAPLLLLMGLGAQMISWDEDFCELLAGRGFHVIRFDNRDSGLSTKFDGGGVPDLQEVVVGAAGPPYTLSDMGADAVGVLDALGLPAAHIVGASMGGHIAQLVAIEHPGQALSLTSIMSAPGGFRDDAPATPEAMQALMTPPPSDREGLIEHGVRTGRVVSGPLFDEAEARRRRTRMVDRAVSTEGTGRQAAAVVAAPSRLEALGRLTVPALVVHGEVDPLVPVENGRRTAAAIPGARLLVLPEMGHDLPRLYWPEIVEAIAETAARADPRVPAPA
jgi:pimeloyl-ACP methyl ester carboxylesterase